MRGSPTIDRAWHSSYVVDVHPKMMPEAGCASGAVDAGAGTSDGGTPRCAPPVMAPGAPQEPTVTPGAQELAHALRQAPLPPRSLTPPETGNADGARADGASCFCDSRASSRAVAALGAQQRAPVVEVALRQASASTPTTGEPAAGIVEDEAGASERPPAPTLEWTPLLAAGAALCRMPPY